MKRKKENSLFLFLLNSLVFLIVLFSYQVSPVQSSAPSSFPKGVAEIPLPKLLDFGAGKCIPCKKMAPILKELAEEYKGRVVIKVIEIYEERELTQANKIRLIPTQIFFDSTNREVHRHEGFMDKEQIKKVFDTMGIK